MGFCAVGFGRMAGPMPLGVSAETIAVEPLSRHQADRSSARAQPGQQFAHTPEPFAAACGDAWRLPKRRTASPL